MNRGEVWWMELPEVGRHPACILARQAAIPVLQTLLVGPAKLTKLCAALNIAAGC